VVRGALVALAVAALVAGCGGASAAPVTTIKQLRQFRILFPEGFTRADMASRVDAVAKIAEQESHHPVKISASSYLAASLPRVIPGFGPNKLQMEGFLFPNTYNFDKKSTSAFLVRTQLQTFRQEWRKVDMSYAESKNLTPYDVLKIASIVQGEIAVPSEMKLAAAVFYNRLHLGMTLGSDAVLAYGLHLKPGQDLTQSQLNSDNPYNSLKFHGLPPTPINNPGAAAIEAAAHPADVDYLYYLKMPNSQRSYFTASYQDFLDHKAAYGY
jgi:UPF0755 protein